MTTPTELKKVLDAHLPFALSSARAIQRVAALYLGHIASNNKINPGELRALCDGLDLFAVEAAQGSTRYAGQSTFGANFTANMKKDHPYFDGDKGGWVLTAEGRAEAKRIFVQGEAPTKRRVSSDAKPKAEKKAKAKPKAKAEKKPKAAKPKAPTATDVGSTVSRKAALRKKKRELDQAQASTPAEPAAVAVDDAW